jgi:hypothetical protein
MKELKKRVTLFFHVDSTTDIYPNTDFFMEMIGDIINAYEPILIPNNACFLYCNGSNRCGWTLKYEKV